MADVVEFWFEFASTYSYPAALRIGREAAARGVRVNWRPFLLGPIFAAVGWSDTPFKLYPAKGRYMWRDMDRICALSGLPLRRPSVFPRNGLHAARVALSLQDEPTMPAFVRAVYEANFVHDRDIGDADVLRDLLEQLHVDPDLVLARSRSDDVKQLLRQRTYEAGEKGIFGSPSFLVGEELFWGNDRLEQALDWAAGSAARIDVE